MARIWRIVAVPRTPHPGRRTTISNYTGIPPIDSDILRLPVGPGLMHVDRYGFGGTPVILLHGFGTSSFLWRHVGPALARTGHTAFAVDLLGFGESDRPIDADYSVAAHAEYVDRAMTALRCASAIVVGVDVGAIVALVLAAARPERVLRLVMVNPPDPAELPGEDVRALQRNTARFAIRASRSILGVAPLLTPILEGSVSDPGVHMPMRLIARYLAPFVGSEGVNHLLVMARSLQPESLEELDLDAVRMPALVVRGESDRWVDDAVAERLAGVLADARVARLPAVGRLVPEEAPDRLVELILRLERARSAAAAVDELEEDRIPEAPAEPEPAP